MIGVRDEWEHEKQVLWQVIVNLIRGRRGKDGRLSGKPGISETFRKPRDR